MSETERVEAIDFDQWADMARTSPHVFEYKRRRAVESKISSLQITGYDVRRLRGLQSRIELERRLARTPMQSYFRLSALMWNSFVDYSGKLNRLIDGNAPPAKPSAKLIQFRK